jgi:hypothetical protein
MTLLHSYIVSLENAIKVEDKYSKQLIVALKKIVLNIKRILEYGIEKKNVQEC